MSCVDSVKVPYLWSHSLCCTERRQIRFFKIIVNFKPIRNKYTYRTIAKQQLIWISSFYSLAILFPPKFLKQKSFLWNLQQNTEIFMRTWRQDSSPYQTFKIQIYPCENETIVCLYWETSFSQFIWDKNVWFYFLTRVLTP